MKVFRILCWVAIVMLVIFAAGEISEKVEDGTPAVHAASSNEKYLPKLVMKPTTDWDETNTMRLVAPVVNDEILYITCIEFKQFNMSNNYPRYQCFK